MWDSTVLVKMEVQNLRRLASMVLVISLLVLGALGSYAVVAAAEDTPLFSGRITAVDKYGN